MKKQLFLGILLSVSMMALAQTQLSNWLVKGYRLNFLTNPATVTLAVPPPPATSPVFHGHNCWYDNQGNLRFYIMEGILYNKFNAQVAALIPGAITPTSNSSPTHFGIAPNPENSISVCSERYYIIMNDIVDPNLPIKYGTFDANGNGGAGSFSWTGALKSSAGNNLSAGAAGSMAISPLTGASRYLYLNGYEPVLGQMGLHSYKITATGITCVMSNYSQNITSRGEMELSNDGSQLAFNRPNGISIIPVSNGLTSTTPPTAPYTISLPTGTIPGMEFDNTGNYLFYTYVAPSMNSSGVFVADLTTTAAPSLIPFTNNYCGTMLEKAFGGNTIIGCDGLNTAAAINADPASPGFATLTGWTGAYYSQFMPDQIDGEDILSRTLSLSGNVARCGAGFAPITVTIPSGLLGLVDAIEITNLSSGISTLYSVPPGGILTVSNYITATTTFEVTIYNSATPRCNIKAKRTTQVINNCSVIRAIKLNVTGTSAANRVNFTGNAGDPTFESINGIQSAWKVQELDETANPRFTINDPLCWHGGPYMNVTFDGFDADLDYTVSPSPFSCSSAIGLFAEDKTYQVTRTTWGTGYGPYVSTVIVDKGHIVEQLGKTGGSQPTGIDETGTGKNAFNIYPNPSKGLVNIEAGDAKAEQIEVYNITGKKVYELSAGNGNNMSAIDLSELPAGIYTIKVSGGGKNQVQRIAVE